MDLTHHFSLPAGMHEAWNTFNDVEKLAPCFPGATITSVQGDEFTGKLKIKLGPATLVYNGSGRYVERNETDHRVLIEASGNDRRRNGTAAVTVTASIIPNGDQTDIEVLTNLAITGKPAQFGDEVISDVSERLLDQFVNCISARFSEGLGEAEAVSAAAEVTATGIDQADMFAGVEEADRTAGFDQADTEQTIELEAVPGDETATGGPAADIPAPGPFAASTAARPTTSVTASSTAPRASEPPRAVTPQGRSRENTLDVLRTVGPVVLRRYGPALAIFALLLLIVIKIVRRKS
jgi:carbon monoxide dehydrogenase subunit G